MRLLLIESNVGVAAHAERELRAAGHEVLTCHPTMDPDEECVVFRGVGPCPLHTGPVDAAIDVRAGGGPDTARELAVTCAVRAGVPLIVAGQADLSVFPWSQAAAVCSPADLVSTCETVLAPVEATVARTIERTVKLTLRAAGIDADAAVSIVKAAGDTAIFVSIPVTVPRPVSEDVAAAVRQVLSGRKDFPERPNVVMNEGV